MNLESIVGSINSNLHNDFLKLLKGMARSEYYLQQAYEGRYFFELIQNVRDANKLADQEGSVFIELTEDSLNISNTGMGFSKEGIESITTIGDSPKESQDLIGFKGIGFKSIQEVTLTPKIITQQGGILFDKKVSSNQFKNYGLKEEEFPLFFYPHYTTDVLSHDEIDKGIVTKILLPLKRNISVDKIEQDFSKVGPHQLLLLGSLKDVFFKSPNKRVHFSISNEPKGNNIVIRRNEEIDFNSEEIYYYKRFKPKQKFFASDEIVDELESDEKAIISKQRNIEITLAFEVNSQGQFKPMDRAQLYLFYPLKIRSGFTFIIHSYFLVNPERTALRNSSFNSELLRHIGKYISSDWLQELKANHRASVTHILCFNRESEELKELYDSVVNGLKGQRFIYDHLTRKCYKPSEVIIADGFDKALFPEGKLEGKRIIFCKDKNVRDWLVNEFAIEYIDYSKIADVVETLCKRQARENNTSYFQNLYNYIIDHPNLRIGEKAIYYTTTRKLVKSNEDVFYGGGRRHKEIALPNSLQKHIYFINKGITIRDFRDGISKTGIVEYSTYELVRRLCKLFKSSFDVKCDILQVLLQLDLDTKSKQEIREKVLLPIEGSEEWESPISTPIYIPSEELRNLYPNGKFINLEKLARFCSDAKKLDEFLQLAGAWRIPAVFIKASQVAVKRNSTKERLLLQRLSLHTFPYHVQHDRVLDFPTQPNSWFCNTVIENWYQYKAFISSDWLPKMQARSNNSELKVVSAEQCFDYSDFAESLRTQKWVFLSGEQQPFLPSEVIGIDPHDSRLPHMQVVKRFLNILAIPSHFKGELMSTLRMIHLSGDSYKNYSDLFRLVHKQYQADHRAQSKEFVDFYNRLLGKLFDYHAYRRTEEQNLNLFKGQPMLAINEQTGETSWNNGSDIYYLDDKPYYDNLPNSVKITLQPHFTNRDRNTFGRLASHIGRKISTSLRKSLLEDILVREHKIQSYFTHLPAIIALLESHIGRSISNEELDLVKHTVVLEKKDVRIEILLNDSDPIMLHSRYFIESGKALKMHLLENLLYLPESTKEKANALNELFATILEIETQKFNLKLNDFLQRNDKEAFLAQYEVTDYRVNEINAALSYTELDERQQFWHNILSAKGIVTSDSLFPDTGVDISELAKALRTTSELIDTADSGLSFTNLSNPTNLTILDSLLSSISLTLEQLNAYQVPNIDFTTHYRSEFEKIKNLNERRFELWLFTYLKTQRISEKKKFQTYFESYRNDLTLQHRSHAFQIDVNRGFQESLLILFPFCNATAIFNQDLSLYNNINSDFNKALSVFNNEVMKQGLCQDGLAEFLSYHINRSLLYFGEGDETVKSYTTWLRNHSPKGGPTPHRTQPEDSGQYKNPSDADIVPLDIRCPNSTGNGQVPSHKSGRRIDGSLKNSEKKAQVGYVAEGRVFDILSKKYSEVRWVSKNASKSGFPEGDDSLGYDIEYLDSDGTKFFVEVKGRIGQEKEFEITRNEIYTAKDKGSTYKIILVSNALDDMLVRMHDLGNIFLFEPGQSLFDNQKFKVNFNSVEVQFES